MLEFAHVVWRVSHQESPPAGLPPQESPPAAQRPQASTPAVGVVRGQLVVQREEDAEYSEMENPEPDVAEAPATGRITGVSPRCTGDGSHYRGFPEVQHVLGTCLAVSCKREPGGN